MSSEHRAKRMKVQDRFDLLCEEKTIDRFLKFYGFDRDHCYKDAMREVFANKMWRGREKNVTDGVKLGDQVSISYLPYSQRYLEHYEDQTVESATLIFFDDGTDDGFIVETCDGENIFRSITREGCHCMGMSRGV